MSSWIKIMIIKSRRYLRLGIKKKVLAFTLHYWLEISRGKNNKTWWLKDEIKIIGGWNWK